MISRFSWSTSARKLAFMMAAVFITANGSRAQDAIAEQRKDSPASGVTALSQATAVRAERAPVIDGTDDDPAWETAKVISGFRVFDPKEDGDPSFQTEARVAYDAENLYVFARMFDPNPDSIVSLLSRRDVKTQSEQIKLMIDSYHDRRTAYEFGVNPAGVKRDYYVYDDTREDATWDAVWDVATRIDSLGWTAEFKIPLSQLRYAKSSTNTFGFGVWRDIERLNERVAWPLYQPNRNGLVSQLGRLTGLADIASDQRIETTP